MMDGWVWIGLSGRQNQQQRLTPHNVKKRPTQTHIYLRFFRAHPPLLLSQHPLVPLHRLQRRAPVALVARQQTAEAGKGLYIRHQRCVYTVGLCF